jgi:hypothetical protein
MNFQEQGGGIILYTTQKKEVYMFGLGFGGFPGIGSSDITVKYAEAKIPQECLKEAVGGAFCGLALSTITKGDPELLDLIMNTLKSVARENKTSEEKAPPKKEK